MSTNPRRQNRLVISSFMLRFVHEAETEPLAEELEAVIEEQQEETVPVSWRGVVKHIQSGEEHHFTTLAEAESFIKKYIGEFE
jgi:hypothetical protein